MYFSDKRNRIRVVVTFENFDYPVSGKAGITEKGSDLPGFTH